MATTLNKFGVPLGANSGRGGLIQPKISHRFRCRFISFGPIAGGLELTQFVETIGRPKLAQEAVEVHSYNSVAYYAGKPKWSEMSLVLRDDITNTVNTLVLHQLQKQMNHFEQTAFASGMNYKFDMLLEDMDGGNTDVFATYNCEGGFISDAEFGENNYSSNEYYKINLTLRFDNITVEDGLMTDTPDFVPGVRV